MKVQDPEILQAIKNDLSAANIGSTVSSIVYPGLRIDGYIREVRDRLMEEFDYLHEATTHNRFAKLNREHSLILVPQVYIGYCSQRVLTDAHIEGDGLDSFLATMPSNEVRNRLGKALFEFCLGSIFKHRIYKCDPHPGNYRYLESFSFFSEFDSVSCPCLQNSVEPARSPVLSTMCLSFL